MQLAPRARNFTYFMPVLCSDAYCAPNYAGIIGSSLYNVPYSGNLKYNVALSTTYSKAVCYAGISVCRSNACQH